MQHKWGEETGAVYLASGLRKIEEGKYDTSNCHGLTFGNGIGQIENENARPILDNDYKKVENYNEGKNTAAEVGDVISYEDSLGIPRHTGRIVGFEETGGVQTPIVISKWSHFAIYRHQPLQVVPTYLKDSNGKFNIVIYRKKD